MTPSEVTAAVRNVLERIVVEYPPSVDADSAAKAAWGLRCQGQFGAPAAAIEWLLEEPNEARFVTVSALLSVSWRHAHGPEALDPLLVEQYMSVFETLPFNPDVELCLVIVLIGAYISGLPPHLERRVRPILERARRSPNSALQSMLDHVPNIGPQLT